MRFKIDENLPVELAEDLRLAGQDTSSVVDERLGGTADPVIVAAARAEGRIPFTLDKGIANLVRYPKGTHAGIVLLRPGSSGRRAVLAFIRSRLRELLLCDLKDRVTVVTEKRIRIR